MPIRAFTTQDLVQLKKTAAAIEKAMASGSLEELRVSGILTRMGAIGQRDLELRYNQCRYELYLRAKSLDDTDANKAALVAQFTNPHVEKIMRVESRSSCYPFTIFPGTFQ